MKNVRTGEKRYFSTASTILSVSKSITFQSSGVRVNTNLTINTLKETEKTFNSN
jgi:hypothetical protein